MFITQYDANGQIDTMVHELYGLRPAGLVGAVLVGSLWHV
jgi:hypothetical protein